MLFLSFDFNKKQQQSKLKNQNKFSQRSRDSYYNKNNQSKDELPKKNNNG